MVDADERRIVQEQLEDLYRKHSDGHDDEVVGFYPPEAAVERIVEKYRLYTGNPQLAVGPPRPAAASTR